MIATITCRTRIHCVVMTVSTMMKTNERVSKTGNRFIGDHRGVRSEAKYRFVPSLIESQREHVGKNRPASSWKGVQYDATGPCPPLYRRIHLGREAWSLRSRSHAASSQQNGSSLQVRQPGILHHTCKSHRLATSEEVTFPSLPVDNGLGTRLKRPRVWPSGAVQISQSI